MGRPKGSRNRKSQAQETPTSLTSSTSTEPQEEKSQTTETSDVTPQPDTAQAQDALAQTETLAPGAAQEGSSQEGNTDEGGMSEHRAAPAPVITLGETIDQMNGRIRSLWRERAMEKEAASADAKEHSDEIKRIEQEIDKLVKRVEELDLDEEIDRVRGVVTYRSRSTGEIKRTRPITLAERQAELPFDRPATPPSPPRATFQDLVDGKVWEHEVHGFVRVLAVLEDSVRVATEDLDEDEAGIEIGRADWDANEAHPREMPELEIGQAWVIDGREAIITGLDDFAALVTWTEDDEPARVARLTFCGAMRPGAQDETPAVPALEADQHWLLADGDLVTIVEVNDAYATVTWAKSGLGGSVNLAAFAGAVAATQEEVDSELVAPQVPEKKPRKRAAAEG